MGKVMALKPCTPSETSASSPHLQPASSDKEGKDRGCRGVKDGKKLGQQKEETLHP